MGNGQTYTQFTNLKSLHDRLIVEFNYANVSISLLPCEDGDTPYLDVVAHGEFHVVKYRVEWCSAKEMIDVYLVDSRDKEHRLFSSEDSDTLEMMIQEVVGLNPSPKKNPAQLRYEAKKIYRSSLVVVVAPVVDGSPDRATGVFEINL